VTVSVCPLRRLGICRRTTVTMVQPPELVYEIFAHTATEQGYASPGGVRLDTLTSMEYALITERLALCPVTAADHPALLAHWTLPDVRRFLFDGEALSAAEVSETIEESVSDFAAGGYGIWLMGDPGRPGPGGRGPGGHGGAAAARRRRPGDLLQPGAWLMGPRVRYRGRPRRGRPCPRHARPGRGAGRDRRGQHRLGRGGQAARHGPVRRGPRRARPHDPVPHAAQDLVTAASAEDPWPASPRELGVLQIVT